MMARKRNLNDGSASQRRSEPPQSGVQLQGEPALADMLEGARQSKKMRAALRAGTFDDALALDWAIEKLKDLRASLNGRRSRDELQKRLAEYDSHVHLAVHAMKDPQSDPETAKEAWNLFSAASDLLYRTAVEYRMVDRAHRLAVAVGNALYAEKTSVELRDDLVMFVGACGFMVEASRRHPDVALRNPDAATHARILIEGFAREAPELGEKLAANEKLLLETIEGAGKAGGRPAKGTNTPKKADAVGRLLKAVGLAASPETLKSSRRRQRTTKE